MQVVHKLSFGRQTNYLYCFKIKSVSSEGEGEGERPPTLVSGSGGHFSPISRVSEPEPRIEAPALVCRDLTNNQHTVTNQTILCLSDKK